MKPNSNEKNIIPLTVGMPTNSINETAMAYWRKSLWNYRKNIPVVFVINGNMLSMFDVTGEIASCNVSSVTAHMAQTATLKLLINGAEYNIRGDTSIISPKPSDEQIALLNQHVSNNSLKYAEAGAASAVVGVAGQILNNTVASGIGSGATVGFEAASIVSAEITLGGVTKLLVKAGVTITGSKPHVALYAVCTGLLVFPIIIIGWEFSHRFYSSAVGFVIFLLIIFGLPLWFLYNHGKYNRNKPGSDS